MVRIKSSLGSKMLLSTIAISNEALVSVAGIVIVYGPLLLSKSCPITSCMCVS